jgi:EAL domain-containing protein (putative c-di-GMP-specific phosphodiesterase class I)/GGDEF domain-containing protein
MQSDIGTVISARDLRHLFQPIIDASNESLLGFEALARGPSGSSLEAPEHLFAAADAAGRTKELDYLCFESALQRFVQLGLSGRLFLNLTPTGLLSLGSDIDFLTSTLSLAGVSAERLVLELTEQAILEDYRAIRGAMHKIRSLGISIAIDDLGAGYSNLRAWSELNPDFVKIDRYFVSWIDSDPLKMEFVRAIVDMARASGSHVIAEGVETFAEASELRDAGVSFLQGYYISYPELEPLGAATETMIQRVRMEEAPENGLTARDLLISVDTVGPDALVSQVADFLHQQAEIQVLPVIADDKPIGIIRRSELLDLLSLPLRHELYGKKPISFIMDKRPLLVESDLKLDQVSRLVTRGNQERLQEQFVVTEKGSYIGMARVVDLLRKITEEQVQSARYSNPLTSLPGNVPIYDRVNSLLKRQRAFVLCYVDIDNFKPFNDFYGYSKGDEALINVGRELKLHSSPRIDFVGHVGGDDFVVVFRSPDWQERITRAMGAIERATRDLYHPEHLEQGGLVSRDRNGAEQRFPLLSVSVAAMICDSAPQCTAEDLAYLIAPIKARAKRARGNSLEIESYDSLVASGKELSASLSR